MASSSGTKTSFFDNDVDDFYFSALFDYQEIFPISDEKYAQELHFQEALVSDSGFSSRKNMHLNQEEKEVNETNSKALDFSSSLCMICMEPKPCSNFFKNRTCTCDNTYCSDCIGKHIAAKIRENILRMKCPGFNCEGVLQPEFCQHVIPKRVFERWEDALCESLILASQKFYCPFKDCSAILIDDDGGYAVTQSECPNCRRLFCAQCKVAWHSGMDCVEYQSLGKDERGVDDLMAMELAKKNQWRRCPNCKFYVEKRDGCLHITCRCAYQFCYGCGIKWTTNAHNCS